MMFPLLCYKKKKKKKTEILSVSDVYNLESLKVIREQLFSHSSITPHAAFQIHSISTRNRHHIRPPFTTTETQRRFVTYYRCKQVERLAGEYETHQK